MKNTRVWFVAALAVLALCLALTAGAEEARVLPAVGDTVAGFTVQEVRPMDVLGAEAVVFTHEKSGATLLLLLSEDTNRAFDITFRTPALDDTGKAHVFEHITICGSTKYDSPNLFFPFYNQTYSTFVNAMTYQTMTSYPVASLSEDQLELMMDFYLSGVFTPILYTEPRMVEREAWRYELTDAAADPVITGTVYSEMKGALTIDEMASGHMMETLFAGSPVAHISGGLPEKIRTLTYEDLTTFHDTYYHPSNALITLYGDLDYERFLGYIDANYLSNYDKRDVYVEKGVVEPLTETAQARYAFPVEAGSPVEKAAVLNYAFAANDADMETTLGLSVLAAILNQESSLFMRSAREKLPGATVYANVNYDAPVPYLRFTAKGCDEADLETLRALVDDSVAGMAAEGLDAAAIEALVASAKISLLNTAEDTNLGVDLSQSFSLEWVNFGTLDFYEIYARVLDQSDAEYLGGLLKTYLLDNRHRALVATVPEPGLAEQNEAAIAAEMAEMKAAMSETEIAAMIENAAAFNEWSTAEPDPKYMEALQVVKVADLPEEIKRYDLTDETSDGVRYVTAEAEVVDLGLTQITLDASAIPVEQLRDVSLYVDLLGSLDTGAHSKEELSTLVTRYLSSFSCALNAADNKDDTSAYGLSVSWVSLMEDYDQGLALVKEILFDTQCADAQTIKSIITRQKTSLKQTLDNGPLGYQMLRASASRRDSSAFSQYLAGPDMYDYLGEMEALADSDPAALSARLEAAQALMKNQYASRVCFAGNADSIAAHKEKIAAFFADLPNVQTTPVDYSVLRVPVERVALVTDGAVQFNVASGKSADFNGKLRAISALIDDTYMLPKLRNSMGAYGAYCGFGLRDVFLYTYRDPSLAESYKVFEELPAYLEGLEMRQSDIDRYIINSYSGYARPQGLLSGALSAAANYLTGYTVDDTLGYMREMKQTTLEDVHAVAARFRAMLEEGYRITAGGASTLEANSELFDTFIGIGQKK